MALLKLALLTLFSTTVQSTYVLQDNFSGTTFFNNFNFFTAGDPTNGFVQYVNSSVAKQNGLISTAGGKPYIGVDYTSKLNTAGPGRQSVRLESKNLYTKGLFIIDVAHMPASTCGTWPAFWMYGDNWPNQGEIDIIEGVNTNSLNLNSLHTGPNCTTAGASQTGKLLYNDCYQYSSSESGTGCGSQATTTNSYGTGLNSIGGGVYATEWTDQFIRVYFFPRGKIPADITNGAPKPINWGKPVSNFQGSCNIPSHFANNKIVFDTTFCGDWAGNVFTSDPTCKNYGTSCVNYVANNPAAFKNSYWSVNYVKVFKMANGSPAPKIAVQRVSSVTPVASTSTIATIVDPGQGAASPTTPVKPTTTVKSLTQAPATAVATA